MKKVYSNEELPHIWVRNSQDEAHNPSNNCSFNGDKYYSYWTVIAKRINGVYVLSNERYSNTTAKQMQRLRMAIGYRETVYCHNVNDRPEDNFNYTKNEIIDLVKKQARARSIDYIAQAAAVLDEFKKYAAVVGYKCPAATVDDIIKLSAKEERKAEAARKKAVKEAAAAKKAFIASLNLAQIERAGIIARRAFHAGHVSTYKKIMGALRTIATRAAGHGYTIPVRIYPDALRIVKGGVITSQGVNISTDEARGLYLAIKRGADIVGAKIAGFEVRTWGNDAVIIGCHTFPRDEFSYISERLFGEAV